MRYFHLRQQEYSRRSFSVIQSFLDLWRDYELRPNQNDLPTYLTSMYGCIYKHMKYRCASLLLEELLFELE